MQYHPEMFPLDEENRPRLQGTGGHSKKFCYTYQDIADLAGLELDTVRSYAKRKVFNPKSLLSVLEFIKSRRSI